MHDVQIQNRFVELRSQDWSFARIAAELNVSKTTLIAWSRKFQFDIQNLRVIELEALREQLLRSRTERARALAVQLQAVETELAKRDLGTVPTGRLFALAESLRRQIAEATGAPRFTSPLREIPEGEYHEHVQDWNP